MLIVINMRKILKYVLLWLYLVVPVLSAETQVRFGFHEVWVSKGEKALIFELNPKNWMFGVCGGWIVDDTDSHFAWTCVNWGIEADYGEGWSRLKQKENGTGNGRIHLFHYSLNHYDSTIGFPARKLGNDILTAFVGKNINAGRVRIKYTITTELVSSEEGRFKPGPTLESDWILIEIRGGSVYLVGYWDSESFRGFASPSNHDGEHEFTVSPPVLLYCENADSKEKQNDVSP
jgi:hypothetical protein